MSEMERGEVGEIAADRLLLLLLIDLSSQPGCLYSQALVFLSLAINWCC